MSHSLNLRYILKNEIIRRYIVINSFDGALTILGIILANFFAGVSNPRFVILPGVGVAVAMAISGIWGAYTAEVSEVIRKRGELEKHLLTKIGKSSTAKQRDVMAFVIGLANGLSPFSVSFVILIPFFIASFNIITTYIAYLISFTLMAAILFLTGVFTGINSNKNILKNGTKMLLAGLVIGAIFFILAKIGLL